MMVEVPLPPGIERRCIDARVAARFPRLRPAGDPAYRTPGFTLRGLDRLPLTLG